MGYKKLAELRIGETGIISNFSNDDSNFFVEMIKLGFTKGRQITRISREEYLNDPSHKINFTTPGLATKKIQSSDENNKSPTVFMFFVLDKYGRTIVLSKKEAQYIIVQIKGDGRK